VTIRAPSDLDRQALAEWLGGTPEEVSDAYLDASPAAWIDAETVPFLIAHSADDNTIPVEHALRMVEALREAEVDAVYVASAEGGHDRPAFSRESGPWTLTFLAMQLHPDV
jgi:dipeptidyl aminopeptidase/acylaminoacyl peptidase